MPETCWKAFGSYARVGVIQRGSYSRTISFRDRTWADYVYWQETDKAKLKRINQLIRDIQSQPFTGIGKPEPLKHDLAGLWSRRIDDEHRLVYRVEGDHIFVLQCRYHYSK